MDTYVIDLYVAWGTKTLKIDGAVIDDAELENLKLAAGVDENKKMGTTEYLFTIFITHGPKFQMQEDSTGNPKSP